MIGKRPKDHPVPQEEIQRHAGSPCQAERKRVLRLRAAIPSCSGAAAREIERLAEKPDSLPGLPRRDGARSAAPPIPAFRSRIAITRRPACSSPRTAKHGPIDLDWATVIRPDQTVAVYVGLNHIES